jgi:hypothetical protein
MFLSQLACCFHQSIGDIDEKITFPVTIKILNNISIIFRSDAMLSTLSRKSGSRLYVCEARRSGDFCSVNELPNRTVISDT